jgi:hypothetical protein
MSTPAPPSATVTSPLSATQIASGPPAARAANWSRTAGTSATSPLPPVPARGA